MIYQKGQKVRVIAKTHIYYNQIGYIQTRSGAHYNVLFSRAGYFNLITIHASNIQLASIKFEFHAGQAVICRDSHSRLFLRQGSLISISDEIGLVDFGDRQLNLMGEPTPIHHAIHLEDLEPVQIPQPGNRKGLLSK